MFNYAPKYIYLNLERGSILTFSNISISISMPNFNISCLCEELDQNNSNLKKWGI